MVNERFINHNNQCFYFDYSLHFDKILFELQFFYYLALQLYSGISMFRLHFRFICLFYRCTVNLIAYELSSRYYIAKWFLLLVFDSDNLFQPWSISNWNFCVYFEGGIGAKRFCSSKDLGNYCNYVQNKGDRMEYRSCIFTCDTDGCNHSNHISLNRTVFGGFLCLVFAMIKLLTWTISIL